MGAAPSDWRDSRRGALALLVALASVAVFFRCQILNGFTLFFGDRYDAMIEVSLLRHWMNVLEGRAAWNVTSYFHPAADTLGYNDGYLAYGLLYAPLRWAGLPLVGAAEAVHAAMKLLGFAGMALLLRQAGCRFSWRLFGAALFTVADLTLQHANHGQLLTLGFAPWALLFGWQAAAALLGGERRRLAIRGAAFLLVFALWISTAFYLAWFFALYAGVVAAVLALRADPAERRRALAAVRAALPMLAGLAALALLLLAPFLLVYLPKRAETGMHPYGAILATAFAPLDYLNATPGNLLWGGPVDLLRRTVAPGLPADHDRVFGLAPPLLLLALVAAVRFGRGREPAPAALAIAVPVCWLLMLRIGDASLWSLVYTLVPGAGGIRVIGRFELLLLVPVVLCATVLLDRIRRPAPAAALAALLLAGEANADAPVALDQREQLAMLAGIPGPPPPGCASFYVVSARTRVPPGGGDPIYAHNVDAMVLSAELARPTVNGFSTFTPPHWDLARPGAPDYVARVRRYAAATGIAMPCRLDVARGAIWTRDQP